MHESQPSSIKIILRLTLGYFFFYYKVMYSYTAYILVFFLKQSHRWIYARVQIYDIPENLLMPIGIWNSTHKKVFSKRKKKVVIHFYLNIIHLARNNKIERFPICRRLFVTEISSTSVIEFPNQFRCWQRQRGIVLSKMISTSLFASCE